MSKLTLLILFLCGILIFQVYIYIDNILVSLTKEDLRPESSQVRIESIDGSGHGSGVYLGGGLVLTNRHVAQQASPEGTMNILFGEEKVSATVLSLSHKVGPDAALFLLESPLKGLEPAKKSCRSPLQGESITSFSDPGRYRNTMFKGIVSSREELPKDKMWTTDMLIQEGSSGGPVFDSNGTLLGIMAARGMTAYGSMFGPILIPTGLNAFVSMSSICRTFGWR